MKHNLQDYQIIQNNINLDLKIHIETTASVSIIYSINSNLDKDATNNLMIAMHKIALIQVVLHLMVLCQILDSLLIQSRKYLVLKMQEVDLKKTDLLIGFFIVNFMDKIYILSRK